MAITFVGSAIAASSSVTIPAHQAGDLLIIHAVDDATVPTLPSGWTNITSGSGSSNADSRIGYKIAANSGTASGTWTNASITSVSVFRGVDQADPIGASATNTPGSSFAIPGLTLEVTDGTSWVFAGIASYFYDPDPNTASGLTQRTQDDNGPAWNTTYDTNAGVASWGGSTPSGTSFGNNFANSAVELKAATSSSVQHIGTYISNANKTSGGSISATVTASVGDTLVLDINTRAGASVTECISSSITDTAGNTWSLAAHNRALLSVWHEMAVYTCEVTNALSSGTVTFTPQSSASEAKVMVVRRFTGLSETVRATTQTGSNTTQPPALTHTGPQAGDLVLGTFGWNGPNDITFTQDTDTTLGLWIDALGGGTTGQSSASNCGLRSQHKIVTGAGSQEWNTSLGTGSNSWNILVALQPAGSEPPGENFDETATAFSSTASLSSVSGVKGVSTSSNAISASADLNSTGAVAANSATELDTAASLTSAGAAEVNTSTSLDTDVSLTSTGTAATETDSQTLGSGVEVSASGTKGADVTASLDTEVSTPATGTAAADASANLDTGASLSATGSADVNASTSLDTEASATATGTAAASASVEYDVVTDSEASGGFATDADAESFDTSLGVSASGTAAASASTSLDTDASLTSSGLVDASTDSEHMSVQMSSDPYPIIDVSGVSNVLEAVALFDEVTALLGDDAIAEFSLTVDFAAAATVDASGTASYPVTMSFGTASVDGSSAADANPLSITVSFDDASGIRDTSVSVSDFDSLVTLDGADASRSVGTQASGLGVNATLGSVTVTSMLWSIYLSVSTVETEIDVPELVTTIPDLSDVAPIPSLDILTQLTDLEIETIVSDIAIQTTIADQTVETVLED